MNRFLVGILLGTWLAVSPALADQAAWVEKATAERAADRIRSESAIRKFCAPCGDREWTGKPVRMVEVRNPSGSFYEVVVNGEGLDLAYTYLREDGRWRNVARMLDLDVTDVPEFLADDGGGDVVSAETRESGNHPLDRELDACLTLDPSTAGMVNCLNLAYEKWDGELNRVYGELRKILEPAERDALKTAQLAWIAYRDAEFALMDRLYGPNDGSIARVDAASRRVDIVRGRALELGGYGAE